MYNNLDPLTLWFYFATVGWLIITGLTLLSIRKHTVRVACALEFLMGLKKLEDKLNKKV
jgi:hypothetical protein